MGKKRIITHKSPDLDSCTAIWILKRFIYPNDQFEYIFVDVGERIENLENAYHVDTGGIDYDHHDTDDMISAASLVYSKNRIEDKSLSKIVEYVVKVDHGKTINHEMHFMNLVNALDGLRGYDSDIILNAALIFLDGIYNSLELELVAAKDIDDGEIFDSVYGKGIAFNSENSKLRRLVYKKGYDIFLFKDQKTGYAGFKADGYSDINFSNLYYRIKEIEPEADWFLHSSKQLVLCGSSKAPQKKLTKLSLNQLIEIIQNYG